MTRFEGTLTALVTPFRDGRIDEPALRELVEQQVTAGIDGLVPCGTTGESPNLTAVEHRFVISTVVQQAKGRARVLAGAGTSSTQRTIEFCRSAEEAGADGVLVVTPYYNRPTMAGLVAHYSAIAEAMPLPIVLYNIPSRTGVDLGLDALQHLSEIASIVGIKEATGGVARTQAIIERFGQRFTVLSGDDPLTLPLISVGAAGVISVASNVAPAEVVALVRAALQGDLEGARAKHYSLLELNRALFLETNPGPVKAALHLLGRIERQIRLPLVWPNDETLRTLRSALETLGVK